MSTEKKATLITKHKFVTNLETGEYFRYNGVVWRRIEPHGFINNSSVIRTVLERGDAICVRVEDGRFTAWKGSTQ